MPRGTEFEGWPLAAMQSQVPAALVALKGDWEELLSPVRVSRRLSVSAPVPPTEVWLRVREHLPESDTPRLPGLLFSSRLGAGRVMLLATAIDPQWTNLPTKPMFVPLIHEVMRSVLGESGREIGAMVCGDRPQLPPSLGITWEDVHALQRRSSQVQPPAPLRFQGRLRRE